MVLAQYTIRSKQKYIYKTNKIVEIMGASENISRAWDILFDQAKQSGLKTRRVEGQFDFRETVKAFDNNELDMIELFIGGGNDTVLFRDRNCFYEANKAFSYYLLNNYPGMIPMAVCQEVSGNYRKDYEQLMKMSDVEKNHMVPGTDQFILPFSLMDRDTFQAVSERYGEERYSKERMSKRLVGIECRNRDEAVKILDKMTTKRGEESLLAVVHADGNNMGSKIMKLLGDKTDYDYCVNAMRKFSKDTADVFVTCGLKAMEECRDSLIEKYANKKGNKKLIKKDQFAFRKVLADGDDVTFICNARFALVYTKAYLEAVQNHKGHYSSCAGICILHSHYSFAEAYHLAEMACDDGAKSRVHIIGKDGKQKIIEEGWFDFHYIHSGVGGELLTIRDKQGTRDKMGRPWCLTESNLGRSYNKLEKLAGILKKYNVTRTDIKTLGLDWESSDEIGYRSLKKVYGHHEGLEKEINQKLKWDQTQLMQALYDLSEIYDLWFAEV